MDTTQSTDTNRNKMYVNGSQVTSLGTSTRPNQNSTFTVNNNTVNNQDHSFGRNEEEKASGLLSHLNEKGYQSTQREWVEPSTLRAFVREQYEAGKELPMDLLGAFVGHKTTIKSE